MVNAFTNKCKSKASSSSSIRGLLAPSSLSFWVKRLLIVLHEQTNIEKLIQTFYEIATVQSPTNESHHNKHYVMTSYIVNHVNAEIVVLFCGASH